MFVDYIRYYLRRSADWCRPFKFVYLPEKAECFRTRLFSYPLHTLDIAPLSTDAIYNELPSTVVPTAAGNPWTFPRAKKCPPDTFYTSLRTGAALSSPCICQKKPSAFALGFSWQGHKDLNPEPTVLETAALPIELYPYIYKRQKALRKLVGLQGLEPGTIRL